MKFIDIHAHIASWPTLTDTEEAVLASMESHGIRFALVSHCDAAEFPSVGDETPRGLDSIAIHEELLAFQRANPSRIGGYFWIRPYAEEVTPRLSRYIHEHRSSIYGLKFHPYTAQVKINDSRLDPYFRLARQEGLPVLVHTAMDIYSSIKYLAEAAERFPDVKFIAAHLELCSNHECAIEVMKKHPNIYCDTAWVDMETAKRVIEEVGEDRIFFGTDNPIDGKRTLNNRMYEAYFENAANLPKKQYEKLMGKNAEAFFHLPR
ncbi:MAG: amidohydrolase family protein [Candidatus Enteromonas sp.]